MTGEPKIDYEELRQRFARPSATLDGTLSGVREPAPGRRVLDHGWVILADVMGNDRSIVEAARISTGQGSKSEKEDSALIRYLLRNRHTTPFEMVEFKFIVKCPMFVWRQWIRHRTASVNEMSGRYVELPEETFLPPAKSIRKQGSMKQGRTDEQVQGQAASDFQIGLSNNAQRAFEIYRQATTDGIAKETARVGLPLSTYTVAYWKIDLHNLLGFLGLRLDPHAQEEIRVYAEAIDQLIRPFVPAATNAFYDVRLKAVTFTRQEFDALRDLVNERPILQSRYLETAERIPGSGERAEFSQKLQRLGFQMVLDPEKPPRCPEGCEKRNGDQLARGFHAAELHSRIHDLEAEILGIRQRQKRILDNLQTTFELNTKPEAFRESNPEYPAGEDPKYWVAWGGALQELKKAREALGK